MVLRIFDSDLSIIAALDLLAHPHSYIIKMTSFC